MLCLESPYLPGYHDKSKDKGKDIGKGEGYPDTVKAERSRQSKQERHQDKDASGSVQYERRDSLSYGLKQYSSYHLESHEHQAEGHQSHGVGTHLKDLPAVGKNTDHHFRERDHYQRYGPRKERGY